MSAIRCELLHANASERVDCKLAAQVPKLGTATHKLTFCLGSPFGFCRCERYLTWRNCCFIGPSLSFTMAHDQIGVCACKQSDRIQNGLAGAQTAAGGAGPRRGQPPASYRPRPQSRSCSFDTWHATPRHFAMRACGSSEISSPLKGEREQFKFSFYGNDAAPFSLSCGMEFK